MYLLHRKVERQRDMTTYQPLLLATLILVVLPERSASFHGLARRPAQWAHSTCRSTTIPGASRLASKLASSNGDDDGGGENFYDDFEDFVGGDKDDDDSDGDDAAVELDDAALASFRSQMDDMFDDEKEEEEDEDEDGDDDDNYSYESEGIGEVEGLSSVEDLIKFATASASPEDTKPTEWATPVDLNDDASNLPGGAVLIANPAMFCPDVTDPRPGASSTTEASRASPGGMLGGMLDAFGGGDKGRARGASSQPSPALLAKFGLTLPPPADLGPDRRADLLPVLVLLERHPLRGCHAVLLNRRTGYLLGDLESQATQDAFETGMSSEDAPKLGAFMIQPLWFGGTSAAGSNGGSDGSDSGGGQSGGLGMLHVCPAVRGATQLTEDGLFWGGDPGQAQEAMNDPSLDRPLTGFDFKFFVQNTRWLPMQLEKEIQNGTWFVASASKEVLFKSRDRLGSKRAKPLWTELMELMGDEYRLVRDELYGGSS